MRTARARPIDRGEVFPPKALLARLDRRLHVLTGGPRDLPARQQTLAGAIAWSYDLLDVTEQALFARLGVFVGGCSIEAAEAVLGDDASDQAQAAYISASTVLSSLSSLVDKSLLRQAAGVDGEARFWMLETVREFALERLAQSGEEPTIRRRHALHFAHVIQGRDGSDALKGWHRRLVQELDNIRGALTWAITSDEAAPALAIGAEFFLWENYATEGRRWLQAMLSLPSAQPLAEARFFAHYSAGTLARAQRDITAARAAFETCIALSQELTGDPGRYARWSLAWCDMSEGDVAGASRVFEQLLDEFSAELEGTPEPISSSAAQSRGWLRYGVAAATAMRGDAGRALALYRSGLEDFTLCGAPLASMYTLAKLGYMYTELGEVVEARSALHEALTKALSEETAIGVAMSIGGIAGLALRTGDADRAARLYGAMTALKGRLSTAIDPDDQLLDSRGMQAARVALGDVAYQEAFAAGSAWSQEQAVAAALADDA